MFAEPILVTGAAGFIGSHTSQALLQRGLPVVGLDNFDPYYDRALKEDNLAAVRATAAECGQAFVMAEGDIRDAALVERLLAEHQIGGIVHLAAKAGVRPSLEQPLEYARANVEGTVALLDAACRAGVRRFLFASSSSVYGNAGEAPFREDLRVDQPISPYAATKVAGEHFCFTYHHLHGLPVLCLRLFTVYGPRQRPDLAINKFVRLLAEGRPLPRFGDGTTQRDYTFVADIVRGLLAALDSKLQWEVLNLGSGNPFTLNEMIAALEEVMGQRAEIEQLPPQPGDVELTHADISKARRLLGWEPQTTLREGMREFVNWWRQRRPEAV